MSKRTFQPNNRRRARTHGFRLRMRTRAGRAILGARRRKGRGGCPSELSQAATRGRAVLPADARLRRSEEFRVVIRGGSGPGVAFGAARVPRLRATDQGRFRGEQGRRELRRPPSGPRRLRHLVSARLGTLPEGSALVVRALPAAATASSEELGADLDAALRRLGLSPPPATTRING